MPGYNGPVIDTQWRAHASSGNYAVRRIIGKQINIAVAKDYSTAQ